MLINWTTEFRSASSKDVLIKIQHKRHCNMKRWFECSIFLKFNFDSSTFVKYADRIETEDWKIICPILLLAATAADAYGGGDCGDGGGGGVVSHIFTIVHPMF